MINLQNFQSDTIFEFHTSVVTLPKALSMPDLVFSRKDILEYFINCKDNKLRNCVSCNEIDRYSFLNVFDKTDFDDEPCIDFIHTTSSVQIQTEIALGSLLQSTLIGSISDDCIKVPKSEVNLPWDRIYVEVREKPKKMKKKKKPKKKDICSQPVSVSKSYSYIEQSNKEMLLSSKESEIDFLKICNSLPNIHFHVSPNLFEKKLLQTDLSLLNVKSVNVSTESVIFETQETQFSIESSHSSTQAPLIDTRNFETQTDINSGENKATSVTNITTESTNVECQTEKNELTKTEIFQISNIISQSENIQLTSIASSNCSFAMLDTNISLQIVPKDPCPISPCPPGGCQACRFGKTDDVCKAVIVKKNDCMKKLEKQSEGGTKPKDECAQYNEAWSKKRKEVSVVYTRKNNSGICGCDSNTSLSNDFNATATSKVLRQSGTTNADTSAKVLSTSMNTDHPILESPQSNVLQARMYYQISKPEVDDDEQKRTIRTRIRIVPQEKESVTSSSQTEPPKGSAVTSALASYENEIRPLREALTSLQQKIKSLNLPDIGTASVHSYKSETGYSALLLPPPPERYQSNTLSTVGNTAYDFSEEQLPTQYPKLTPDTYYSKPRPKTRKKVRRFDDDYADTNPATERSPIAEMYVNLAKSTTSSSTFYANKPTYNMPSKSNRIQSPSSSSQQPVRLTPDNFILGSTAMRTDPDMMYKNFPKNKRS